MSRFDSLGFCMQLTHLLFCGALVKYEGAESLRTLVASRKDLEVATETLEVILDTAFAEGHVGQA